MANKPTLRRTRQRYHGRNAWLLENDRIHVCLLEGGGHVAEIALAGEEPPAGINPLWQPSWKTMEPYRFFMARDGARYGNDAEARLLSGIRGHNVCFDYWSGPSPDEMRLGLSFHGEAGVVRWRPQQERVGRRALQFTCRADLKLSAARFTRTVSLRRGEAVAYFEETAENLLGLDRAVGWVEHVTIGPPFLKRGATLLDLPATRGYSLPDTVGRVPPSVEFDWPFIHRAEAEGEPQPPIDLRLAAPEERSGFNLALLLDPAREFVFVSAATPELRLLLAYVFRRADFPWLDFWEQNGRSTGPPWNGKTLAVGLEFGNTIVPGSRRAMAAFAPEMYGTATYGWLGARACRTIRYIALLAEIPEDYMGTADIRVTEEGMEVVERGATARVFSIPCNAGFL